MQQASNRKRRGNARVGLAFVAALALLLQVFAVQSHAHVFGLGASAVEQELAADDDAGAELRSTELPTACVFCEALASGHRVLPSAATSWAERCNAAYLTQALAIRRAPRALTHSWRSRAPPHRL